MHPMDEHVVDTMIHDVLYLDKVYDVVASLLLPLTPDTDPSRRPGGRPTCSGVILARRVIKNSLTSLAMSMDPQ